MPLFIYGLFVSITDHFIILLRTISKCFFFQSFSSIYGSQFKMNSQTEVNITNFLNCFISSNVFLFTSEVILSQSIHPHGVKFQIDYCIPAQTICHYEFMQTKQKCFRSTNIKRNDFFSCQAHIFIRHFC